MTSVPIWSVLPHLTVDESSMEMVQPYHGNHFLMDLIHQPTLTKGSDTLPITLPIPSSHPSTSQNVTRSLSNCFPNQIATKGITSLNDDTSFLLGPSHSKNGCEESISLHEPTTKDNTNTLVRDDNQQKNKLLDLPINEIYSVQKRINTRLKNDKLSLDSMNSMVTQQFEILSTNIPKGESSITNGGITKVGEFFCQICDTNYWTAERFSLHLEQKEFICRTCTTEFTSHSDLKIHFLSHRGHRCGDCDKYFVCKEDLCNHRKSSLICTSAFECNICNKMYSSFESVRRHKQDAHQIVRNMYNCLVCDSKFNLQFRLNSHLKRYHVAYEEIECTLCSMSFLGPEKLKIHKKKYHLRKKEPCSCSTCGKVFYSKDYLKIHEKSHYDINDIVCEFCGKSCKGRKGLSEHVRYNHNLLKINCKICNKEFKSVKCFRRHKNSAHKPKTPVICEVCGKTLKNKEQLKSHLLIHSSERGFKCDICNATFKQLAALRTHGRTHTSVCKYSCDNCGKSFRWKQTFDKHKDKCSVSLNN